jgi:hypothetical protein|tara:strand:+ start:588 stop:767 length:180 start_codon:yes stop_codon:yes gene_type:complete
MANNIDYGSVYSISWWGAVNEANNWGWIYPFDADDSNFRADTTLVTADNTRYTADKTNF